MAKATVTVGCKLPHGLHLDINGKRVTVNGVNSTEIIGGYGMTKDVDKEFFDAWMALNREHPAVKNELIFSDVQTSSAHAKAVERKDEKTGFEAIDPKKPGPGIEAAAPPGK